ncbi:MAG: FAD-dependent oxidoreductase, partial [Spongiibacter sp.]
MNKVDFFIAGGGIVGATLALELRRRFPDLSVILCEKEDRLGAHASTRNSGVIHSGIYYDPNSVKAKVCHEGAKRMIAFHEENSLPIRKMGKLLVCPEADMTDQIDVLYQRAGRNGLNASLIDETTLKEMEPEAHSAGGRAIFVPMTAVGDPAATMQVIEKHLSDYQVKVITGAGFATRNRDGSIGLSNGEKIAFGYFINAAGGYADKVAHAFDVGHDYKMLPFRGLYWQLASDAGIHLNHLVYPVPDLRFPFLGVHTTTTVDGRIYLGPTASPGFGREHYRGFAGVNLTDTLNTLLHSGAQFWGNRNGFRNLAFQEIKRLTKGGF